PRSVVGAPAPAPRRGHGGAVPPRRGPPPPGVPRPPVHPPPAPRLRARLAQRRALAGRPRGGGDHVTRRDQPRNQVPSQCPGRSRNENPHCLSLRMVFSLKDKPLPEVVTSRGGPALGADGLMASGVPFYFVDVF